MSKREPSSIGEILARMIKGADLSAQFDQAEIWQKWPELAGPHLSTHGRPVAVRDGTLIVEADSSVWMHRFAYQKWQLIKNINKMAGQELVSDIFVKLPPDEDPVKP